MTAETCPTATSGPPGRRPTGSPPAWQYVVGVFGAAAQALVALGTVTLGLGWSGGWHSAAVAQAALGLAAVLWLLVHGRLVLLIVPPLSALLTWTALQVALGEAEQTECSATERAAVADLHHPAGATPELAGELGIGCIARFSLPLPPAAVLAHYERALPDAGWVVSHPEPEMVSGLRRGVRIAVHAPEGEGGLVIVSVDEVTGAGEVG